MASDDTRYCFAPDLLVALVREWHFEKITTAFCDDDRTTRWLAALHQLLDDLPGMLQRRRGISKYLADLVFH